MQLAELVALPPKRQQLVQPPVILLLRALGGKGAHIMCASGRMSKLPHRHPTVRGPGVHGLLLLGELERLIKLDEDGVQLLQALAELPREPRRVDAHPVVLHDFIEGPLQVASDPADVVAVVPPGCTRQDAGTRRVKVS